MLATRRLLLRLIVMPILTALLCASPSLLQSWVLEPPAATGQAVLVEERAGAVFVGTDDGVWRIAADGTADQIVTGKAVLVEERAGAVFVGTFDGVWRIAADGTADQIETGSALLIEERAGAVFVGTYQGVWRIDADGTADQIATGYAVLVEERAGVVFVGTTNGVWHIAADGTADQIATGHAVLVEERAGAVFVGTGDGVWRIAADDTADQIATGGASFVEERAGAVFVGTDDGVLRIAADGTADQIGTGDAVFAKERAGAVFVGTTNGVWRITADGTADQIAFGEARWVEERAGAVFVGMWYGVARLNEATAKLSALQAASEAALWERLLSRWLPDTIIGTLVRPTIAFDGPDAARISVPPDDPFGVILDSDLESFEERVRRGVFLPVDAVQTVSIGFPTTIHVAIRDDWGIVFRETIERWVLPSAGAQLGLVLLVPPVLVLLALLAAPYSRFCHGLIMNPFLRGYASFGVVPLVLTLVPPARRHVLRRFRRALRASDDIKGWAERFVPPEERFTAAAFAELLGQRSRLLIVGVSGVGKTSFLRHLAACVAKGKVRFGRALPLPVYLPLGRYAAGVGVEAMIRGQLENLGELHDQQFVDWLIRHGGFLFLFDGLNEIGSARRDEIVTFVEQRSQHNWVVAASQDGYAQQFGHWGAVETMPKLTRAGIEALLQQRLGEDRARSLVASLDEQQTALLALPQNLELALELTDAEGLRLPDSEEGLFRAVFERQFAAWREAGTGGFIDLLTADAYAMLRDRAPATLPPEITGPLIERKLMRQLGDAVYFRHDTLRGYAASIHVAGHWRELLGAEDIQIDANWDTLLRFTAAGLLAQAGGAAEVQALVFALLDRAPQRAAALSDWLAQEHGDAVGAYRAAFDQELGRVTRQQLALVA